MHGQDTTRPMTDDEKLFFVKLGERIAKRRAQLNLTQAQVAEELGVSQQTVNSFERGRRRVPVSALPILARVLALTLEELVEGKAASQRAKRGPASKLHRQIEMIQKLPRAKQRFVVEMLDTVIAQAQRPQT